MVWDVCTDWSNGFVDRVPVKVRNAVFMSTQFTVRGRGFGRKSTIISLPEE